MAAKKKPKPANKGKESTRAQIRAGLNQLIASPERDAERLDREVSLAMTLAGPVGKR